MSVAVSRAHGGCGEPHSRPVSHGAPAKIWALNCPQCSEYLANDPLWSGTLADVPTTPDEDLARDNAEKSTTRSREDIMALALAKIAGLPVAEFLEPMIKRTADYGTIACAAGHENVPSSKFCAECGARLVISVPAVPDADDRTLPAAAVTVPATVESDDQERSGPPPVPSAAAPARRPARQVTQPKRSVPAARRA
jgi:hypothetical protein